MACCLQFLLRLVFCYPHPVLATFVCSCKRETDQEETAIWSFAAAEYAKKSHETAKPPPRSYRSVVKDLPPSLSSVYYKTFSELCQRVE